MKREQFDGEFIIVRKTDPDWDLYINSRFQKHGGLSNIFWFRDHNWRYEYTSFDDISQYDVLYRPIEIFHE